MTMMEDLFAVISKKFEKQSDRRRREDVRALSIMLDCAEDGGKDFVKLIDPFGEYDPQTAKAISFVMKQVRISNVEELKSWAEDVMKYAQSMAERVNTGQDNEAFDELMKIEPDSRDRRKMSIDFMYIAVICRFIEFCPEFAFNGDMQKYIENVHPYDVLRLLKNILQAITGEEKQDIPEAKPTDSGELQMRLTNLQNALDRAKARNDMYREEIDKLKASAEKDAMMKIFARMNSRAAGNLLDQFASAGSYINELESQSKEIPAELRSLVVCVKSFMNFLQNIGVNMLHSVGDTLSINLAESEDYDYTGSDFEDENDRKNVRVRNPGWSCNGTVFSIPSVYEIRGN